MPMQLILIKCLQMSKIDINPYPLLSCYPCEGPAVRTVMSDDICSCTCCVPAELRDNPLPVILTIGLSSEYSGGELWDIRLTPVLFICQRLFGYVCYKEMVSPLLVSVHDRSHKTEFITMDL